jgi:hypothetical protein
MGENADYEEYTDSGENNLSGWEYLQRKIIKEG